MVQMASGMSQQFCSNLTVWHFHIPHAAMPGHRQKAAAVAAGEDPDGPRAKQVRTKADLGSHSVCAMSAVATILLIRWAGNLLSRN